MMPASPGRRNAALLSALGTILTFSGIAAAQKPSISDAQVEANVLRALAGEASLATQQIKTTTVYGTVTLGGSVTDEASRTLAETLASKAQGVQKVVDELTLAADSGSMSNQGQMTSQPSDSQQGQPAQPVLQSDGTYTQPAVSQQDSGQQMSQAQPEPGYQSPPAPPQQSGPYDNGASTPRNQGGPPVYRQPYRAGQPTGYPHEPPSPQYGAQEGGRSVSVPSGALVRIRLVEGLTAKLIKPGTPFDGTVLNDVIADGEVAIPRGAAVQGTIVQANASGAVGGKGQLALQLNAVSLSGHYYPIVSDTWTHYGRDKTGQTVQSAIGLGGFGALIGALAGGGTGAAIGAATGVAAGVGVSAASGRHDVVIPAEAIISFHLVQPASVITVSQQEMDRLGYGVQQSNLQRRPMQQPADYGRPGYYPAPY